MADVSYLKDMPIAILGGGAVGKTMAADCALAGKEVRIWDQPRFAKTNFQNIEKTGITLSGNQFSFFGFQRRGIAKVALATDNLAEAVKGAGIIVVATVALGHEPIFKELILSTSMRDSGQSFFHIPSSILMCLSICSGSGTERMSARRTMYITLCILKKERPSMRVTRMCSSGPTFARGV